MTSGSSKIHPLIIDRFENSRRNSDVMPACIASSFPHLPNDVYKTNFTRDDQASETSSPEIQRYESYSKGFEYPKTPFVPDDFIESNQRKSFRAAHAFKSTRDERHQKDLSPSKSEDRSSFTNSTSESPHPEASSPRPSLSSPSHHLKRQSNHVKKSSNGCNSPTTSSPTNGESSPPHPRSVKKTKDNFLSRNKQNQLDTSDILRKMYATFGTEGDKKSKKEKFNSPNDTASRSSSRRGSDFVLKRKERDIKKNEYYASDDRHSYEHDQHEKSKKGNFLCKDDDKMYAEDEDRFSRSTPRSQSMNKQYHQSTSLDSNENNVSSNETTVLCDPSKRKRHFPLPVSPSGFHSHQEGEDQSLRPPNSKKIKSLNSTGAQPPIHNNNEESFHRMKGSDSKSFDSKRKRKHSEESSISSVPLSDWSPNRRNGLERKSPSSKGSRRSRYSSSDSVDSQPKAHQINSSSFCKNKQESFPYMNPLLYSSPLAGFSFPTNGYGMSIPGLPPTNPLSTASNSLMLGPNPYLANSLLFREMLNPASAVNMMSLFSNPNLAAMPLAHGFSMDQLQALQQMQASTLYQKPGVLLNPNGFQPSVAALSNMAMQYPFFHALNHQADAAKHQNMLNRGLETNQTMDQRTFPDEPNQKLFPSDKDSNSSKSNHSTPVLDHRQKNDEDKLFNPKRQRLTSDKNHQYENTAEKKCFNKNSHHSPRSSKSSMNDGNREHDHEKFSTASNKPTVLKKRTEKKTCDKSKPKGVSNHRRSIVSMNQNISFTKHQQCDNDDGSNVRNDEDSLLQGMMDRGKSAGYKNLTRERRLVANARERTRVHTISSAFDELRTQIPSYSCNQKLSKLAILRIACSYIRTLSVLAGRDVTTTFPQGVDQCTRVLQSESRARSRRKSNKAQIEWEMVNYERHKTRDDVEYDDDFSASQKLPVKCCKNPSNDPPSADGRQGHSIQGFSDDSVITSAPVSPTLSSDGADDAPERTADVDVEGDEPIDVLDDVKSSNLSHDDSTIATNETENDPNSPGNKSRHKSQADEAKLTEDKDSNETDAVDPEAEEICVE